MFTSCSVPGVAFCSLDLYVFLGVFQNGPVQMNRPVPCGLNGGHILTWCELCDNVKSVFDLLVSQRDDMCPLSVQTWDLSSHISQCSPEADPERICNHKSLIYISLQQMGKVSFENWIIHFSHLDQNNASFMNCFLNCVSIWNTIISTVTLMTAFLI